MNVEIKLELPPAVFSALRTDPADFVKQIRLAAAAKRYEIGRISQSKASEIAGVSRHEFLENLNAFGISPFQTSSEELLKESNVE